MFGEPGAKGHADFHFFRGFNLEAVRSGPWKLHFGTPAAGAAGKAKTKAAAKAKPNAQPAGLQLFNLDSDIGESKNVAEAHPDVVQRLQALADAMHADLGTREVGPGVRPLGRVQDPQPFLDRDGNVRASAVGSRKNFP